MVASSSSDNSPSSTKISTGGRIQHCLSQNGGIPSGQLEGTRDTGGRLLVGPWPEVSQTEA